MFHVEQKTKIAVFFSVCSKPLEHFRKATVWLSRQFNGGPDFIINLAVRTVDNICSSQNPYNWPQCSTWNSCGRTYPGFILFAAPKSRQGANLFASRHENPWCFRASSNPSSSYPSRARENAWGYAEGIGKLVYIRIKSSKAERHKGNRQ